MKAAFIRQTGGPEAIQIGEIDEPEVGDSQVLIRIHAVSVNPIDLYIRSGAVEFDLHDPFVIGCDGAGVVEQIGERVGGFSVGDRVWCTNQGLLGRQGTFAEKIAVDTDWCFRLPNSVGFEDAAACGLVAVTAHLGLFREAKLQAGETILVIGGTGGVGSMVVQMARATGARVIATAGSKEKCERALSLGADVAINYKESSIVEAVREHAPRGVNVFWETRQVPDFDAAVEVLASHGRMILLAGRSARPEFPVGPFYVNQCSLHGFVMFRATQVEMHSAADDINHWLLSGKLKANIDVTMPIEKAAEAHRMQEAGTLECSGELAGKIVLTF